MGRGGANPKGRVKVPGMGVVRAEDAERGAEIIRQRVAGRTFDQIAEQLGMHDAATVRRSFQRAIKRTVLTDEAIALREVEYQRLEQVHRAVLVDAIQNRNPESLRILLKASEQRAKLTGINVNEALAAGASAVSAAADLAAASMLQANLIGVLHEEGLPVEQIERIIGRLNDRMGVSEQAEDEGGVVEGEVV